MDNTINNILSYVSQQKEVDHYKNIIETIINSDKVEYEFTEQVYVNRKFFYSNILDRDLIIDCLKKQLILFNQINEKFKNDREIMLIACDVNHHSYVYLPYEFKNDRELALKGHIFDLSYHFRQDKEFIMEFVENRKVVKIVSFLHIDLRKDFDVVKKIVSKYGRDIEYAHSSLKKNIEIVLAACKESIRALAFVDRTILSKEDIQTIYQHELQRKQNDCSLRNRLSKVYNILMSYDITIDFDLNKKIRDQHVFSDEYYDNYECRF